MRRSEHMRAESAMSSARAHLLDRTAARRERSEALIEGVVVGELVWLKEVEYGPELRHVVLEGGAGENELPTGAQVLHHIEGA